MYYAHFKVFLLNTATLIVAIKTTSFSYSCLNRGEMDHASESEQNTPTDGILTTLYYGVRKLVIPTSPSLLIESQKSIFDHFVKVPTKHRRFVLKSGEYLNYIDIDGEGSLTSNRNDAPTLILTHGFGSGLGFFFSNYDNYAIQFKRVISVDWIGMGGSSRPSNAPRIPFFSSLDVAESSDFFIDNLEELRQGLSISNYVLAGHSLGGYLSARYAMKYHSPELKGLILLSPAGLAPHPSPEEEVPTEQLSLRLKMFGRLWENNWTPQTFSRIAGHFAPGYVKGIVDRRFGSNRWNDEQTESISDYLYHISALPASGEFAMNTLLIFKMVMSDGRQRPRVFAREPITSNNLQHLAGEKTENDDIKSVVKRGVPILILYGDSDWISFPGVSEYVDDLKKLGIAASLAIIRKAGHHLYMDNPEQCHDEIRSWWEKYYD